MALAVSLVFAVPAHAVPMTSDTAPASGQASANGPAQRLGQGLGLIMVDSPGCAFCARWKREVLPGYAHHPAGRAAPLTIISIDGPWPDGLALASRPMVTPTFILTDRGLELARIEGHDRAETFWPALRQMLAQAHAAGRPDQITRNQGGGRIP